MLSDQQKRGHRGYGVLLSTDSADLPKAAWPTTKKIYHPDHNY